MTTDLVKQRLLSAITPSSAKRCLFGPVNHDENRQFLKELSARLDEQCNSRWNFDFKTESPLPGRFSWERLDSDTCNENSPTVDPLPATPECGSYRLRVGLRSILKTRRSRKLEHHQGKNNTTPKKPTTLPFSGAEDSTWSPDSWGVHHFSKRCDSPEELVTKPRSIVTNFEYQAYRKFFFKSEAGDESSESTAPDSSYRSSPVTVSHAAVQCELTASASTSSSSSSSAAVTADACLSLQNAKRKQSTILEYFPLKKAIMQDVQRAKRRLDL